MVNGLYYMTGHNVLWLVEEVNHFYKEYVYPLKMEEKIVRGMPSLKELATHKLVQPSILKILPK
jgi:hypothetical protein